MKKTTIIMSIETPGLKKYPNNEKNGEKDGYNYPEKWDEKWELISDETKLDGNEVKSEIQKVIISLKEEEKYREDSIKTEKGHFEKEFPNFNRIDFQQKANDAMRKKLTAQVYMLLLGLFEMFFTSSLFAKTLGIAPLIGYLIALVLTMGLGLFWFQAYYAESAPSKLGWYIIFTFFCTAVVLGSFERAKQITDAFENLPMGVIFPFLAILAVGGGIGFGVSMVNRQNESKNFDKVNFPLKRIDEISKFEEILKEILKKLKAFEKTLDDLPQIIIETIDKRRGYYNLGFQTGLVNYKRDWDDQQNKKGRFLYEILRPFFKELNREPMDPRPEDKGKNTKKSLGNSRQEEGTGQPSTP